MKCKLKEFLNMEGSRPPQGGRGLKLLFQGQLDRNFSRPPQGGRGLKLRYGLQHLRRNNVAPRKGGVG